MPDDAPIPVLHLDEVDSTNAHARRRLEDRECTGGPEWIVASVQTAGKGRDGRLWSSPSGGLWATLIWPLSISPPSAEQGLGLRIGVALTESVAAAGAGDRARLKWPNDVLVGGKKIAGVLTELVNVSRQRWAIVGCGVNVRNRSTDLPANLRGLATSLLEHGSGASPDDVLDELSVRLRGALTTGGLNARTLARARRLLFGIGEPARVRHSDGGETVATLLGLRDDGRAEYRDEEGCVFTAEPVAGD